MDEVDEVGPLPHDEEHMDGEADLPTPLEMEYDPQDPLDPLNTSDFQLLKQVRAMACAHASPAMRRPPRCSRPAPPVRPHRHPVQHTHSFG